MPEIGRFLGGGREVRLTSGDDAIVLERTDLRVQDVGTIERGYGIHLESEVFHYTLPLQALGRWIGGCWLKNDLLDGIARLIHLLRRADNFCLSKCGDEREGK
jgi:hypothetical protein